MGTIHEASSHRRYYILRFSSRTICRTSVYFFGSVNFRDALGFLARSVRWIPIKTAGAKLVSIGQGTVLRDSEDHVFSFFFLTLQLVLSRSSSSGIRSSIILGPSVFRWSSRS